MKKERTYYEQGDKIKRANKKNDLSNKGQEQQDKLEDAKRQTELNKERT